MSAKLKVYILKRNLSKKVSYEKNDYGFVVAGITPERIGCTSPLYVQKSAKPEF
jgi:hypothetical protein